MQWGYRPELDGLRTLAVVIIIFFHAGVEGWGNSFIALDLFFVLSGFLVTNVVLTEIDKTGSLRLGNYYARRVRRLLPAAVAAIVLTSIVFLLVASQPERLPLVKHAQAALVYLANWQFIAEAGDYFAGDMRASPFMHYWSLSIEEQFYIFFPLLILAVHRFFPGKARALTIAFASVAALSVASQLYWGQVDPNRAYYATDARVFQLMAGALLAVGLRELASSQTRRSRALWYRRGRTLIAAGLIGYLVFGSTLVTMSVSHRNILATFLAGALVVGLYCAPEAWLARPFALPGVVYLGKISYGTYLWHWPTILLLITFFEARPIVVAATAGVVSMGLAAFSYELLETPIRRAKRLNPVPWRTVTVGLTTSVLAAVLLIQPILGSGRPPAVTVASSAGGNSVAAGEEVVDALARGVPDLDYEKIAERRGTTGGQCTPEDVESCVRFDGDGPHVVLVGDSQARTFVPAFQRLAEEEGFKFSTSIATGCPFQAGLYNSRGAHDDCEGVRDRFYEETLEAMGADVVILLNMARSAQRWEGRLVDENGESGDLHEMQLEATTRTADLIGDAGAKTVFVHSIFGTEGWGNAGFEPLDCLARATTQEECVVTPPLGRPVVDGFYETLATSRGDVHAVDYNKVICPDAPYCRPILNGDVVWRDANHLGTDVLIQVREKLWKRLEKAGVFD